MVDNETRIDIGENVLDELEVIGTIEDMNEEEDDPYPYINQGAISDGSPIVFITPNGTVIDASEYATHADFLDETFELYEPEFYDELLDMGITPHDYCV